MRDARAPGLGNVPGQALHVAAGLRPGRGESAGQRVPGQGRRRARGGHHEVRLRAVGRGDALPRESPAHIGQPALCQPTGMAPAAGHRGEGRLGEPIQGVQPDAGPGHQGHIRGAGRPLGPDRTSLGANQGAAKGGKPPLAKPIAGRAVTVLCQAFQHGQCKAGQSCPNGQHRCAAILRGDRVCGMQNHGAKECRAAKKSRGCPGGEGDSPIGSELSHPHTGSGRPHVWSQYAPGEGVSVLGHDLSNPVRQQALEAPMRSAAFTAAALDCSTKSRAREIPRTFADGRQVPNRCVLRHTQKVCPGLTPRTKGGWTWTMRHVPGS